jgi:NADPH:quinone reductase
VVVHVQIRLNTSSRLDRHPVAERIGHVVVVLKGVHVLGFQFRDFVTHAPADAERNEHELMELLASRRVASHIGAAFELDAAALGYVADGRAVGKVVLGITSA